MNPEASAPLASDGDEAKVPHSLSNGHGCRHVRTSCTDLRIKNSASFISYGSPPSAQRVHPRLEEAAGADQMDQRPG